jgi:hypothetical protein
MEPYILQITMELSKKKVRTFAFRFSSKEDRDEAEKALRRGSCLNFPAYRKITDESALEALEAAKEK